MMRAVRCIVLLGGVLVLVAGLKAAPYAISYTAAQPAAPQTRVSRFGEYRGYSEAIYDGWVRSSQYITARDGTRLALDLFRPASGGKVAEQRFPVIWGHHRYHRASVYDGKIRGFLDEFAWVAEILKHG